MQRRLITIALAFSYLCLIVLRSSQATKDLKPVEGEYLRPGVTAAEILRARGYLAKEFNFYTSDGYKLTIVRGRNPLINEGKSALAGLFPILFVHGTIDAAPTHLASATKGARPQNFRERIKNLSEIQSAERLIELLNNDNSTKNLPCLAMNFGYEVWLINRRGFNQSKGRRGHENRTLAEAIASVPASLLGNGFHFTGSLDPERPNGAAIDGAAKKPNATRSKDLRWNIWRELILEGVTLKNLPGALADFGKFQEQFIQTFDPDYWNFSLDEQAEFDIPDAIDFVSQQTGCSRVHTVGLSSGGALLLLAPANKPELASKIASAILWAPSLNMGTARDRVYQLGELVPIFQTYIGPIPFVFSQQRVLGTLQTLCATDKQQRGFCSRLADLFLGFSGRQEPVGPNMLASVYEPTSINELIQLGQFARTESPCKFKFNDPKRNLEKYGQLKPPCYDLGRVEVKHISAYVGNEDILVSPTSVNITRSQLRVPMKLKLINEPGLFFNHVGSILHDQANRLALVPSLLDIERAQESSSFSSEVAKCCAGRHGKAVLKSVN